MRAVRRHCRRARPGPRPGASDADSALVLRAGSAQKHHFNMSLMLTVKDDLNLSCLAAAVDRVVVHHDALRLRYEQADSGWSQWHAAPEDCRIGESFQHVNISEVPATRQSSEMSNIAADFSRAGSFEGTALESGLHDSRSRPSGKAAHNRSPSRDGRHLLAHSPSGPVYRLCAIEARFSRCASAQNDFVPGMGKRSR